MTKSQLSNPKRLGSISELEKAIFSYENLNWAVNKLKKKYYLDFIDRFPSGFDKETLDEFLKNRDENLKQIINRLKTGTYKFSPFLERKIPKSHKKALILCRGCLRDVIVQVAINRVLVDKLQRYYSDGLYSGRKKGSSINVHSLIKRVFKFHREGKHYALKLDIKDYFNQINRNILKKEIRGVFGKHSNLTKIIESYIDAPRLVKGRIIKRKKGIPIGTHLANLLSNIYLTSFDDLICKQTVFYARYADDIFVVDKSRCKVDEILKLICNELKKYSLEMNEDKLEVVMPGEPFEYLGYKFIDGNIYIRKKSIKKFKNKVKACIARERYRGIGNVGDEKYLSEEKKYLLARLIEEIDKLICGTHLKGWVRYFARSSFCDQFHDLDIWIRNRLRKKLIGRWSMANYRKFPNEFFKDLGLKSLVREYYRYHEKWKDYSRPLFSKITSISNLGKALDYYLEKRNLNKNPEVRKFLLNKRGNLEDLHESLLRCGYKFSKPRKKEIKRFDTKETRYIFISCFRDRVVQRAIMNVVSSYFDHLICENVYSYRKGTSVLGAVSCLIRMLRNRGDRVIFRSDFESFNKHIDLYILRSKLQKLLIDFPKVLQLFENFLGSLESVGFLPKGIPLSNFLLNLYLADFDSCVSQKFDGYIRYSDDFIVFLGPDQDRREVRDVIEKVAEKLNLKLKGKKTKFVKEGEFKFLGYKFNLGTKLRISVSDFSLATLRRRIKRLTNKRNFSEVNLVNFEKKNGIKDLIRRINYFFSTKKRMSWSKYYCRIDDFEQIRDIDQWICDRIRLCITKKMNLKNRKLISYSKLRNLDLVSTANWIYLAKKKMYNMFAYQNREV